MRIIRSLFAVLAVLLACSGVARAADDRRYF